MHSIKKLLGMKPNLAEIEPIKLSTGEIIKLKAEGFSANEFIGDVNNDILLLNQAIRQYNQASNSSKQQSWLKKIYELQKNLDNNLSPTQMQHCEDYRQKIHHQLFYNLQEHFRILGLPTPTLSDSSAPEFAKILAEMAPEKADQLLAILNLMDENFVQDPNNPLYTKLINLYTNTEHGYQAYQSFIKNNSIEFLGGINSKNIKIKPKLGGEPYVLKVENRLNMPKQPEVVLREKGLKDTLLPVYTERYATSTHNGETFTRTLQVTKYCNGNDLDAHAKLISDNKNRTESALTIYSQMGSILEKMTNDGYAFTDMKNTNWLVENDTVRLADSKSFVSIQNGNVNSKKIYEKWHVFLSTVYMNPPEFYNSEEFSADKMHSFMLGKNLYQYLTQCDINEFCYQTRNKIYNFNTAKDFSFNHSIFKSEEGKALKKLIKALVLPDPDMRMTTQQAISELERIKLLAKKNEANVILQNIEKLALQGTTERKNFTEPLFTKLDTAKNINELDNLKNEFAQILADLKKRVAAKKACFNLIKKLNIGENDGLKPVLAQIQRDNVEALTLDEINNIKTRLEDVNEMGLEKARCRKIVTNIANTDGLNRVRKKLLQALTKATNLSEIKSIEEKLGNLKALLLVKAELNAELKTIKPNKDDGLYEFINQLEKQLINVSDADQIQEIKNSLTEVKEVIKAKKFTHRVAMLAEDDRLLIEINNKREELKQATTLNTVQLIAQQLKNLDNLISAKEACKTFLDTFPALDEKDALNQLIEEKRQELKNIIEPDQLERVNAIKIELEELKELANLKEKNRNQLAALNDYKEGYNDNFIDEEIAKYTQAFNSAINHDAVNTIAQQRNQALSTIKDEISLVVKKDYGSKLLSAIANQYRFAKIDPMMDQFIRKNDVAIQNTTNSNEINEIISNLTKLNNDLNQDKSVQAVKHVMESMQKRSGFFKNAKATQIITAMGKVPVEERVKFDTEPSSHAQAVLNVLASHRHPGFLGLGKTLYRTGKDKHIDDAKAAKSYSEFKLFMQENRSENVVADVQPVDGDGSKFEKK